MAKPFPSNYADEMMKIKKNLKQFSYQAVAGALEKIVGHTMTAALVGCIIPESGSDHTVINKQEYLGQGASGTEQWNCGEGLIGFTFWKYKLPLIQQYNADSRSTQKLPTNWGQYNTGRPVEKGKWYYAPQDGKHIAGLTLPNQMLLLTMYYKNCINNKLKGETDFPTIVAKIYQEKAGIGLCQNIADPVQRAYETAKKYYKCSSGNHYLQSLKIGMEYLNGKAVDSSSIPLGPVVGQDTTSVDWSANSVVSSGTPVDKGTISQHDLMGDDNGKPKIPGRILGTHIKQK